MTILTTEMHKSPALCSDLCNFLSAFVIQRWTLNAPKFARTTPILRVNERIEYKLRFLTYYKFLPSCFIRQPHLNNSLSHWSSHSTHLVPTCSFVTTLTIRDSHSFPFQKQNTPTPQICHRSFPNQRTRLQPTAFTDSTLLMTYNTLSSVEYVNSGWRQVRWLGKDLWWEGFVE